MGQLHQTSLEYTSAEQKRSSLFGKHCAIMPEEIVERCVRLFSYVDDVVLDPFTGSRTTLKIAKKWGRKYVGYETVKSYSKIINAKLEQAEKHGELKQDNTKRLF